MIYAQVVEEDEALHPVVVRPHEVIVVFYESDADDPGPLHLKHQ